MWIVSGPSGSGKTTLCEALLREKTWRRRLMRSVSCTTRRLRRGERAGRDYVPMAEKEFLRLRARGGFLESEKIFGSYYGTPRRALEEAARAGKDLLLCIDVKGARNVRRKLKKDVVSIFVVPPSIEVLMERLSRRATEGKKEIVKRLKRVKIELAYARFYDYILVNGEFREALRRLKSILEI
ncbi:MAG: guanylate kinase [Deltaproteobacteria bacterium]